MSPSVAIEIADKNLVTAVFWTPSHANHLPSFDLLSRAASPPLSPWLHPARLVDAYMR